MASFIDEGFALGGVEKAKEYYLKAFIYGARENSGEWLDRNFPEWRKERISELETDIFRFEYFLKPVAEAGVAFAQLLMGEYSFEGGMFWKRDREKAEEWLLKAKAGGFSEADNYLQRIYEEKAERTGFHHIEDTVIYEGYGIKLEFCGILQQDGRYGLAFRAYNYSSENRTIWVKNCLLNKEPFGTFFKLGEYLPDSMKNSIFFIDSINPEEVSDIVMEFELDLRTHEIATLCRLNVRLDGKKEKLSFSTEILSADPEPASDRDEELSGKIYYYSCDNLCKKPIYISFSGVYFKSGHECEVTFFIQNDSGEDVSVWAHNVMLDGEKVCNNALIIDCENNKEKSKPYLKIHDIDYLKDHQLEMEIEVYDKCDRKKYTACGLTFKLFAKGDRVQGVHSEKKDVMYDIAADSRINPELTGSSLYCPDGSYWINFGIDLYFEALPPEPVKGFLESEGWKWYNSSKECWHDVRPRAEYVARMISGDKKVRL